MQTLSECREMTSGCSVELAREVSPNFQGRFPQCFLEEDSKPVLLALCRSSCSRGEWMDLQGCQDSIHVPPGMARGASFLGNSLLLQDDTGPQQHWKVSHYPEVGDHPRESMQHTLGWAKWPPELPKAAWITSSHKLGLSRPSRWHLFSRGEIKSTLCGKW